MTDESKRAKPFSFEVNPKIEVATSIGPVFIYDPGHKAVEAYAKQAAGNALVQVRAYLAGSASATERKKDSGEVLSEEQARALTDNDVEKMAGAYLGTMNNVHYIAKAKAATPAMQRETGETSVAFLDRLLRWRAEDHKHAMKELMDEVRGGSAMRAIDQARETQNLFGGIDSARHLFEQTERTRKMMDQAFGNDTFRTIAKLQEGASGLSKIVEDARRHQSALDALRDSSMLRDFKRAEPAFPEIPTPPAALQIPTMRDHLREVTEGINEAVDRREKQRQAEREEELQINRNIREMTLKSSELLAQLTHASATMLEKFSVFLAEFKASAERADDGARRTLRWAAISVAVTAVLTLGAGVIAIQSYRQDKADIESDDRWQSGVSQILQSQVAAAEKARQDLAIENGRLRQRIEALEKTVGAKAPPQKVKAP